MALNITNLGQSVHNLQRLQHIARVLTQHGFGHIVERLDLGRFVPLWLQRGSGDERRGPDDGQLGRRLTQAANDLGPVFVKMGQMLATRPDVVPADVLEDLLTLQDRVEPFDTEHARRIIERELKQPVGEAYKEFGDEPIAAGSIGQVYKATLLDGRKVVVKVKRPNIESDIRADLSMLAWLADAMERWIPESQTYKPKVLVEEFERTLLRELDYLFEAATTSRMHEFFAGEEGIQTPDVVWSHTTEEMLTLLVVDGVNIDQAIKKNGATLDKTKLARRLADLYFKQYFELGTFHADPHSGNILVKAPDQIGLIDFGQIGVISEELSGHLLVLALGGVNLQPEIMADALAEMGAATGKTDRMQLTRDLQTLLNKYVGQPMSRISMKSVFAEFAEAVRRNEIVVPRDVLIMFKSLATVWGVALRLDPELDLTEMLKPRVRQMLRRRVSPKRAFRVGSVTMWHLLSFLKSGPQQLRDVLQQVSSGKWQVNIRHENLEGLGRELDRASNRLSFSVVIAAIVVGSSLMVTADPSLTVFGLRLQTLAMVGYLIAGVLGLGLLWAIFRSGRLS